MVNSNVKVLTSNLKHLVFSTLVIATAFVSCKSEPENTDEDFYSLIDQGDSLFNINQFSNAKNRFVDALEIKPDHQNTIDKIALIDSLLSIGSEDLSQTANSNSDNKPSTNRSNNSNSKNESDNVNSDAGNNTNSEADNKTTERSEQKLKIGDEYIGGIIFEINEAGTKGKVIDNKDMPAVVYKWKNVQSNNQTVNGVGGWRIPSIDEMKLVQKNLFSKGLIKFSSGQEYWAKGEWNGLMGNSYFMRSSYLSWENAAKNRWLPARFVKDFTVKGANEAF